MEREKEKRTEMEIPGSETCINISSQESAKSFWRAQRVIVWRARESARWICTKSWIPQVPAELHGWAAKVRGPNRFSKWIELRPGSVDSTARVEQRSIDTRRIVRCRMMQGSSKKKAGQYLSDWSKYWIQMAQTEPETCWWHRKLHGRWNWTGESIGNCWLGVRKVAGKIIRRLPQ